MNITEYQELAKRTCASLGYKNDINHMILGVISELGELADAYKKNLAYGKELDVFNVAEEISDVVWYIANLATVKGVELRDPYALYPINKIDSIAEYMVSLLASLSFKDPQLLLDEIYTLATLVCGVDEEYFFKSLENNINKLKIRYPENFTTENALNRNLVKERVELEK